MDIKDICKNDDGLKTLIRFYRKRFRIPENIDYYSEEDFKSAEKKFIKFALGQE